MKGKFYLKPALVLNYHYYQDLNLKNLVEFIDLSYLLHGDVTCSIRLHVMCHVDTSSFHPQNSID